MSGAVFSKQALIHAAAGSLGGMISMMLLYPLDQVRTYMQVSEKTQIKNLSILEVAKFIIENEGFNMLYRGLIPVVSTIGATNFVYFFSFNFGKLLLVHYKKIAGVGDLNFSVVEYTFLSTLAGIVTVFMTAPLWVANTRLKMGQSSSSDHKFESNSSKAKKTVGLFHMMFNIAQTEGIRSLWDGTIPSLILVSNPIIQFVVYEVVKSKIIGIWSSSSESPISFTGAEAFILGAIAKACATIVTYPLQLTQSKLRIKSKQQNGQPVYSGTVDCLLKVQKEDGVLGLYRGMNAKLLQTVLNGAFMFMNYENIVAFVNHIIGLQSANHN